MISVYKCNVFDTLALKTLHLFPVILILKNTKRICLVLIDCQNIDYEYINLQKCSFECRSYQQALNSLKQ